MSIDPQRLLRELFASAIDAAHPRQVLADYLPEDRSGRVIVIGAGKAAAAMADYWTTFARTGNPNGGDRPVWPEVGADGDSLLEFTNDGPVAKPIPFSDRLDLIETYYARVR